MTSKREGQEQGQPEMSKTSLDITTPGLFHGLYTLWLFPVTEFYSAIIPCSLFAVSYLLSVRSSTADSIPDFTTVLASTPKAVIWMWFNLLSFTISNQRLAGSILEDSINKSWRPLPSKRISADGARRLLLMFAIPATLLVSLLWGAGLEETIFTTFCQYMYNDLAGADEHWAIRALLNAVILGGWNLGCSRILTRDLGLTLNTKIYQWLQISSLAIFSTVHLADFRDQDGDQKTGRRTIPIEWGDGPARYITSLVVLIWSLICPVYWSARLGPILMTVTIGTIISSRLLVYRNKAADRLTWKLWGVWIISLYTTPLFQCCNEV
ncbi:hypothetical protein CROQUDRAFT_652683 [Cronartium quercuum f. sp. fusiforme G11]|uniref:Uncharacterized protein n=1 Tax=Cronartium quercuum f. sp. fusiforme G11 TaxID=708437 RepID=A0A9P6TFZ9_9BASI|nr:hypothetical protein CROQUDRAFT_652683 [Cronartium quercuum f. sp. fusiforme G11]